MACADGTCDNWSDTVSGSCVSGTTFKVGTHTNALWKSTCTNGGTAIQCSASRVPSAACAEAEKGWTAGGDSCVVTVPAGAHGTTRQMQDTSWRDTGSASFSCVNSSWALESGAACYDGCSAGSVTWGGGDCGASVARGVHGATRSATDAAPGHTGSASFTCDDGAWKLAAGSTCHPPCAADTGSWSAGGDDCSAALPETARGSTAAVSDDTWRDTGSASFACGAGGWSLQAGTAACHDGCNGATEGNCTLKDTVHGASSGTCPAGWNGSCSASCTDGNWGTLTDSCAKPCGAVACADGKCGSWSDTVTGSCDAGTFAVGTHTNTTWHWTCTNGGTAVACSTKRAGSGNCTDTMSAAECGCRVRNGTWVDAVPERERTCTGNRGCTTHTHSCTTPADPAGGYLSCTYKKHKGGLGCASHSHATCNPYPAVAGHCHVAIDPGECPMCCGDDGQFCP